MTLECCHLSSCDNVNMGYFVFVRDSIEEVIYHIFTIHFSIILIRECRLILRNLIIFSLLRFYLFFNMIKLKNSDKSYLFIEFERIHVSIIEFNQCRHMFVYLTASWLGFYLTWLKNIVYPWINIWSWYTKNISSVLNILLSIESSKIWSAFKFFSFFLV